MPDSRETKQKNKATIARENIGLTLGRAVLALC